MESPAQKCARLVGALEDLAGQEAAAVEHQNFEAVAEIQQRAEPLVAYLVAEGAVIDAATRERLITVQRRRSATAERLRQGIAQVRAELEQIGSVRRRVGRVAPVYGAGGKTAQQISLVG